MKFTFVASLLIFFSCKSLDFSQTPIMYPANGKQFEFRIFSKFSGQMHKYFLVHTKLL